MKELSIEEKAKRYDEALVIARSRYSIETEESVRVCLELMFSELKESEDEKIRKELIRVFSNREKYVINQSFGDINVSDILAWLEKQGEKKSFAKYKVGDTIYYNSFGRLVSFVIANIIEDGTNNPMYEDKDGNSVFQNDIVERKTYGQRKECKDCQMNYAGECKGSCQMKRDEQKSAEWEPQTGDTFRKKGTTSPTYHLCDKREDGITFGFVENRETGFSGGEITIFALKDDYELVERPKSIEDAVEEELNKVVCPNNVWSEEDENIFNRCIINIQMVDSDSTLIDWLKSLKDRFTWKPSEGQLECLGYAIEKAEKDWSPLITNRIYLTLKALKEQLEKL